MFIKIRTQYASKDGIELAVFVAFGEVLSFGHAVGGERGKRGARFAAVERDASRWMGNGWDAN